MTLFLKLVHKNVYIQNFLYSINTLSCDIIFDQFFFKHISKFGRDHVGIIKNTSCVRIMNELCKISHLQYRYYYAITGNFVHCSNLV